MISLHIYMFLVKAAVDRGRPSVLPRRVSMLSTTSRPKPPPPIRRTSSVTRTPIRQDTGTSHASAASLPQKPNKDDHSSTVLVTTTTRRTYEQPPSSTVRRTLSSAYADVIQTLNSQLTSSDPAATSTVRRPYRRAFTTTDCIEDSCDGGRIIVLSGSMPQADTAGCNGNNNKNNNNNPNMMTQIKRGVVLRQTSVTNDRSAPKV
jgi:hypothetical protein